MSQFNGAFSGDLSDPELSAFYNYQISPERLLVDFENLRDLGPAELVELTEHCMREFSLFGHFKYEMRALRISIFKFGLKPKLESFTRRMKYWHDIPLARLPIQKLEMSSSIKDLCIKFNELKESQLFSSAPPVIRATPEDQVPSLGFAPYISIVVTSRNDNHGGYLTRRTRLFLETLALQVEAFALDVELILVDWNPPDNAKSLLEELELETIASGLRLHLVTVPALIHMAFSCGANYPLYQMIAKNVGIRRATGDFVLCTNVDILFSNELISFLASKPLLPGVIYRVERWDVRRTVYEVPRSEAISFMEEVQTHAYRANVVNGFRDLLGDNHEIWERDEGSPAGFLGKIFTNACGDFQLMSRSDWEAVRGYPEWNVYSMHLDSVLQYKALSKGKSAVVLPSDMRIYHVDHGDGWTLEAERSGLFEAIVKKELEIQKLTFDELRLLGYAYFFLRGDANENNPNWGLRDVECRSSLHGGDSGIRRTELKWSKSFDDEYDVLKIQKKNLYLDESEFSWESDVILSIDYLHRTLPRGRPILIWGAGARGAFCLKRLREIGRQEQIIGILESDRRKWGLSIEGLEVYGPSKLEEIVRPYIKIATSRYFEIQHVLKVRGLIAFSDYL